MALTVAVLMGGWSAEREVSLISGQAVVAALQELGHQARPIDVQHDLAALIGALTNPTRPDVIFNALHGRGGEDGTIQGVLDFLGIPYTHSGVMASAIAMDKPLTKVVAASSGIRVPAGKLATLEELRKGQVMPPPYVVKPPNEGSSVGVRIVRVGDNQASFAMDSAEPNDRVLVETYIPGRELTVGIMGDHALGVTEIEYQAGFFDYTVKYTEGHAKHVLPARIPPDIEAAAKKAALAVHQALGCRGISRSDFRYDDSKPGSDGLYFLEINTQPGFTPLSLVPEQAKHAGISFPKLVDWILQQATCGD